MFNPEKGSFPENSQLSPAQKWENPDIVGKLHVCTHCHPQLQIGYQDRSSFIIVHLVSNTLNIFKKHLSKSKGKSSSTTFREVNMKKNLVWYYTNHHNHSLLCKKKDIVNPVPATHPGSCRTGGAGCGAGCCVGGRMCHSDAKPLQFSRFSNASCHLRHTFLWNYGTWDMKHIVT